MNPKTSGGLDGFTPVYVTGDEMLHKTMDFEGFCYVKGEPPSTPGENGEPLASRYTSGTHLAQGAVVHRQNLGAVLRGPAKRNRSVNFSSRNRTDV